MVFLFVVGMGATWNLVRVSPVTEGGDDGDAGLAPASLHSLCLFPAPAKEKLDRLDRLDRLARQVRSSSARKANGRNAAAIEAGEQVGRLGRQEKTRGGWRGKGMMAPLMHPTRWKQAPANFMPDSVSTTGKKGLAHSELDLLDETATLGKSSFRYIYSRIRRTTPAIRTTRTKGPSVHSNQMPPRPPRQPRQPRRPRRDAVR
jgi:hypothetical protein